ncbi:MAG TPA: ADOP family duplicated permease [Thermoanaerobaculia bacterium]|nr:ADOP family duplicated permease [Thermoanaerobaculia bacterium]
MARTQQSSPAPRRDHQTPPSPTSGATTIATLLANLALAVRRLARARGFTAIAVLTLALALGVHVAIFGLVRALFLESPPAVAPERLVTVHESRDGRGFHPLSYPDYLAYRDAARSFEGLAAEYLGAPLDLRLAGESIPLGGAVVSGNFFSVLGLEPHHGRLFLAEEGSAAGRPPVAVLSEQLWRSRFGGTEDALGVTISLNGTDFTVVGVAPPGARNVRLGTPVDVWIPTSQAAVGYRWCNALDPDCTWLDLVGRLAPGRTIDDARAELTVIARSLRAASAVRGDTERGVSVAPLALLHPSERDDARRLAGILSLAVSLLLLIAGASLAGLLVARGLDRRREITIRLAMGAPAASVVGLFLAETLILGLAGGLGGLWTATWFTPLASRFYGGGEPLDLSIEAATVIYAIGLSAGVGLAVGLLPALQATRRGLLPGLRDRSSHRAAQRAGLLGRLLSAQVALAMVLLTGTGLLASAVEAVGSAGAADPDRVATLRLRPRLTGLDAGPARAFTREAVARLEAVPGVRSVSLAAQLPPGRSNFLPVLRPGAGDGAIETATQPVAPRFFATLGVPLLSGRDFDDRDREQAPLVAIVNRTLADTLWPETTPGLATTAVGRTLQSDGESYEIVGMVDDSPLHLDPAGAPVPQLYLAYWQDPELIDARLVAATTGPAAELLSTLRTEVAAVDPRVPVTEVADLSTRLRGTFARVRLASHVLAVTGGLSLFLCAICLHGVLTLMVTRRTRELGIRAALGATRAQVVALAVRDTVFPVGTGLALGAALSAASTSGLGGYLYTVTANDPSAFAGAALALLLVALLASWRPARRAAGVDPAIALRE